MNSIKIIDFMPEHQHYFEKFNRAWIEKYFWMEPTDVFVLTRPEDAILKQGGAILMAEYDGEIAGTVALRRVKDGVFEFTKMAVDEPFRRKGIAEALSHAAIKKALSLGAERIILFSQKKLKAALALYQKLGFKELPIEPGIYTRADVKMELDLGGVMADSS